MIPTGKRRIVYCCIFLSVVFLFSKSSVPPQLDIPTGDAKGAPIVHPSSETHRALNRSTGNTPLTTAIIVVTDANRSEDLWIVARLEHFKCYSGVHGYTFVHHVLNMKLFPGISFYTARWQAILETYWDRFDWIFTHDTDSIYPDFSINLDRFAHRESPHVQAIARSTEIGANALLLRSSGSPFSKQFLTRLVELGYEKVRENYDVQDMMLLWLEYLYPELSVICKKIDSFLEFVKCSTPIMYRLSSIPTEALPMMLHGPMSGFVQQFEAPASKYGLLHGACWPGHLLMSGSGLKERAPLPMYHGHKCAIDNTMHEACRWLTREEQLDAAKRCCLNQATICADGSCRSDSSPGDEYVACKIGWPVIWAFGKEVTDPKIENCSAPYLLLNDNTRGNWNTTAHLEYYERLLEVQATTHHEKNEVANSGKRSRVPLPILNNVDFDNWCNFRRTMDLNAESKMKERASWFEAAIPHERDFFRTGKVDSFVLGLLFNPYYPCPFTLTKTVSVSENFDGGKWVCGLTELKGRHPSPCRIYSFGSNYDTSFEDYIDVEINGKCDIHIFDPTMTLKAAGHSIEEFEHFKRQLPSNYEFHNTGLCAPGENTIEIHGNVMNCTAIHQALRDNGHFDVGIDVMKFDVEGFEFGVLESTSWVELKIGLILFEFHSKFVDRIISRRYTLMNLHHHFARLESAGYRLYSMEPVCSGCTGQFEVAFIHADWHPRYGFSKLCASDSI